MILRAGRYTGWAIVLEMVGVQNFQQEGTMKLLMAISAALFLSGCASIVSRSVYDVTINSNPNHAHVLVTDSSGKAVYEGETPATVSLNASTGYFSAAQYDITATLPGHAPGEATIAATPDVWYWIKFVFLGPGIVIGILIVDPITGAMWELPDSIDIDLGGPLGLEAPLRPGGIIVSGAPSP